MTGSLSLSTMLGRVTAELRRIEGRLSNLEQAIGEIVLEARSPRSPRFHDLQDIDLARQEVAGIAEFLDNLVLGVRAEWQVDSHSASRSLGLEGLAAALGRGDARDAGLSEYEAFE
jgi:hypothetical protein